MAYIILTHLEISNFKDWNHQHDIGHTCDSHPHGVLHSNEKIIENLFKTLIRSREINYRKYLFFWISKFHFFRISIFRCRTSSIGEHIIVCEPCTHLKTQHVKKKRISAHLPSRVAGPLEINWWYRSMYFLLGIRFFDWYLH